MESLVSDSKLPFWLSMHRQRYVTSKMFYVICQAEMDLESRQLLRFTPFFSQAPFTGHLTLDLVLGKLLSRRLQLLPNSSMQVKRKKCNYTILQNKRMWWPRASPPPPPPPFSPNTFEWKNKPRQIMYHFKGNLLEIPN